MRGVRPPDKVFQPIASGGLSIEKAPPSEPLAEAPLEVAQRKPVNPAQPGQSLRDAEMLRFQALIRPEIAAVLKTTLEPALFECSVPESNAIVARRVDLVGRFDPEVVAVEKSGRKLIIAPSENAGFVFGGERYVELPNSTALTTTDPRTGVRRELVITRGVRPYENTIDPQAGIYNAPKGYVSDVLLFERTARGLEYQRTLLRSDPDSNFLFEDPRISVLHGPDRPPIYLLSGTDYSPHLADRSEPDVMNRGMILELDEQGLPRELPVDPHTHRPKFFDLSPPPSIDATGNPKFIDAKNGTAAINESGELVLRTRMRMPPEHRYAEQILKFQNFEALASCDWKTALTELRTVATEETFREHYPPSAVGEVAKRGFGPGTIPVRIERRGDELYVSEDKYAPQYFAGKLSPDLKDRVPIRDGGVVYLTFDHELRVLRDRREDADVPKRVYSSTLKLWNPELDAIELVYADAVQPRQLHQRGDTGILDLHHTYPMGRVLVEGSERTLVRVYAGAADAHTESYDFDLAALFEEMAVGSERRTSGQVYALTDQGA